MRITQIELPGSSHRSNVDADQADDADARRLRGVDIALPKKVGIVMDIADMDAVMSFMQTHEAADAMAYDGVLPETLVSLVEQQRPQVRYCLS
jgi:hypothetical protein